MHDVSLPISDPALDDVSLNPRCRLAADSRYSFLVEDCIARRLCLKVPGISFMLTVTSSALQGIFDMITLIFKHGV